MSVGVSFEVPGLPQPQGSLRGFVVKGHAVLTNANPKLRSWRREVVVAAKEAMLGKARLEGPVKVTAQFCFPRPAGHFGKRGLRPSAPVHKITAPDTDRCARALLDALMVAGVIRDDAQVVILDALKRFDQPCTQVEVWELSI